MTERVAFQVKVYSGYTDSKEDIRLCNKVYKKLLLADVPIDPEPVRVAVNFANEITWYLMFQSNLHLCRCKEDMHNTGTIISNLSSLVYPTMR